MQTDMEKSLKELLGKAYDAISYLKNHPFPTIDKVQEITAIEDEIVAVLEDENAEG